MLREKVLKTIWGKNQSFLWYSKFPAMAYRLPEQQPVPLPLCSIVCVSDNFFLNPFLPLPPKKGHSSDLRSLLVFCVYYYLPVHLRISADGLTFLDCEHQGKTVLLSLHRVWSFFPYLSVPHFSSCPKKPKQTNTKTWIMEWQNHRIISVNPGKPVATWLVWVQPLI